jgi:hypothetical protein
MRSLTCPLMGHTSSPEQGSMIFSLQQQHEHMYK